MKPNQSTHPLPDFDADLEDDAVWNLLDDATPTELPPRFVNETLRRIRLEEDIQKISVVESGLCTKTSHRSCWSSIGYDRDCDLATVRSFSLQQNNFRDPSNQRRL